MSDIEFNLSGKDYQKLHNERGSITCIINDYKNGIINESILYERIESYVQRAYELGIWKGRDLFG